MRSAGCSDHDSRPKESKYESKRKAAHFEHLIEYNCVVNLCSTNTCSDNYQFRIPTHMATLLMAHGLKIWPCSNDKVIGHTAYNELRNTNISQGSSTFSHFRLLLTAPKDLRITKRVLSFRSAILVRSIVKRIFM